MEGGIEALVLTVRREAPERGVQFLDAGLPFRGEDLAGFLAKRPATLRTITIHESAQAYDWATLKRLADPRGAAGEGGVVVAKE